MFDLLLGKGKWAKPLVIWPMALVAFAYQGCIHGLLPTLSSCVPCAPPMFEASNAYPPSNVQRPCPFITMHAYMAWVEALPMPLGV